MTPGMVETIFVLGAGFTRAFLPRAPLLIDDYGAETFLQKFQGFSHVQHILKLEMAKHSNGFVDIERLMSRLDGRMPYDYDQGANEEFSLLLSAIKKSFRSRIEAARADTQYFPDLKNLAAYCIKNRITCISFNYDDLFDQMLWDLKTIQTKSEGSAYWHPDGGYGFFCKPSLTCVRDGPLAMDQTAMLLLKLHGSMNWRLKRGYSTPYAIDAVVHHESWIPSYDFPRYKPEDIEPHLESDAFMVPPVLVKSSLVEQPILRLIWSLAYRKLEVAKKVVFVGYSFPVTDLASNFLFSEAIKTRSIKIVNFSRNPAEQEPVRHAYRKVFDWLPDNDFDFRGALEWSREIVSTNEQT